MSILPSLWQNWEKDDHSKKFKEGYHEARIQVLLAVAYSANTGGTGTLTGTTPNLILKAVMDEYVILLPWCLHAVLSLFVCIT